MTDKNDDIYDEENHEFDEKWKGAVSLLDRVIMLETVQNIHKNSIVGIQEQYIALGHAMKALAANAAMFESMCNHNARILAKHLGEKTVVFNPEEYFKKDDPDKPLELPE
jgi:hypothetical protein